MRQSDFLNQLHSLLRANVSGLTDEQKIELMRKLCDEAQRRNPGLLPTCQFVPFVTGRRPTDEVAHPGLGSSDSTSLLCEQGGQGANQTYLLYSLADLDQYPPEELDCFSLDVTLSFAGPDDAVRAEPIPGWNQRPIEPQVFEKDQDGRLQLRTLSLRDAASRNLVLALSPERDFLPESGWAWETLDEKIRARATDAQDPFTVGHLFSQIVHVSLRLMNDGVPLAGSQTLLDVCDARRLGSLYQRIVERVVKRDTSLQAEAAGLKKLDHAYHPWFPVLHIGSDKAALYTEALAEDIVHKKRHLTDPRWLMRVGLYLEFLTCLGICEAVKGDMGDLLSPAERDAFENSPFFAELRRRINPRGWRKVWQLREIVFPTLGAPQTGPVSVLNLQQKKKATLAFLTVHHDDLKQAIELAGPNTHNAQETWHRVFRDAERAVLRKTPEAFPELGFLHARVTNFILWHQQDNPNSTGAARLPRIISRYFGDQDGLFASACLQYRASMNEVALWAKARGLLDYTGSQCIPEPASLLWAYMRGDETAIERLQHRDGYLGSLESIARLPDEHKVAGVASDRIYGLLVDAPVFAVLTEEERRQLANTAREIRLGPLERIVVEGRQGSSLFLVGEGRLEVFCRQADGKDQLIDRKAPGDVIGEGSLLTGAARTATVRAAGSAVVYEIGKKQYEPIIKARPEIVDELALIMEKHASNIAEQREVYAMGRESTPIRQRVLRYFLAG